MAGVYRGPEIFAGRRLFAREKITYVSPRALPTIRVAEPTVYRTKLRAVTITDEITSRFENLKERWQNETRHLSSVTQIVLNPAYQQIIGMGPSVLPLILAELVNSPHHWFWALMAITGENPVPEESVGNLRAMREAWLEWSRRRGLAA